MLYRFLPKLFKSGVVDKSSRLNYQDLFAIFKDLRLWGEMLRGMLDLLA